MGLSEPLYLGLDVGTQSTKGVLITSDPARGVVAQASSPHRMVENLAAEHQEQDPEVWLEAIATVCRRLFGTAADASRLRAIGVSGQQHGAVLLDERDRVVRPAKLWCDTATVEEAEELSRVFQRRVPCGYTASKILYVVRHEPEHWARTRTVFLPHDYVNAVLTGVHATEAGDASGTGYFDEVERAYSRERADAIHPDLFAKIPPLMRSDGIAGRVTAEAAQRFGLPEGVPVSAGSGDNMMSAFGSGATRPGPMVVSLGTSATVFAYSPTSPRDPAGLLAPFCDATGGYLPLICVMNATGLLEEVRCAFGVSHRELTAEASLVAPGAEGLIFLPFLLGERVPELPRATGTLLGLRPGSLRRQLVYRAAIEGVTFNLAAGVDRFAAAGIPPDSLRVVGGGARNPLWIRILADVTGLPVEPLEECESAALGAALSAQWASRRELGECVTPGLLTEPYVRRAHTVHPDPIGHERYRGFRAEFAKTLDRIFGASR